MTLARSSRLKTQPTIKCAMRSCDWKGREADRVPHPTDVGKSMQRLSCPECGHDKFSSLLKRGAPASAYVKADTQAEQPAASRV
jgi:hypothetical protein